MLHFLYLVNKQGKPRVIQYYTDFTADYRKSLEIELVKRCISRDTTVCSFFEWQSMSIVYRKYATLYFIVGIDESENELAILEFLHCIVETLDKYFDKACELDVMFNLDRVNMILEEMIVNGKIVETNKCNILAPIQVMDAAMKR